MTIADRTSELKRLEQVVNQSEGDGLLARWKFGRCMLEIRGEKAQLERGVLATLAKDVGVHRSELTARMKFAEKYPTEETLTNVISKFKTWFAIKQQALTTIHRVQKSRTDVPLRRVLAIFENIDYETLGKADLELLAQIEEGVQRLKEAIKVLKAVA